MKAIKHTLQLQSLNRIFKTVIVLLVVLFSYAEVSGQGCPGRICNNGALTDANSPSVANFWRGYVYRGNNLYSSGSYERRGYFDLTTLGVNVNWGTCSPARVTSPSYVNYCSDVNDRQAGDGNDGSNCGCSFDSNCGCGSNSWGVRLKRTGFPAGLYRLAYPTHDDRGRVFLNGTQIYVNNNCCGSGSSSPIVNFTGGQQFYDACLDASSALIVDFWENGGGAAMNFTVTPLQNVQAGTIQQPANLCQGNNISINTGTNASISSCSGTLSQTWWVLPPGGGWINTGINAQSLTNYGPLNTAGTWTFLRRSWSTSWGNAGAGADVSLNVTVVSNAGITNPGSISNPGSACLTSPLTINSSAAAVPPSGATLNYIWWAYPPGGPWHQLTTQTGASLINLDLTTVPGNTKGQWQFCRRAYTNCWGSVFVGADIFFNVTVEQLSDALAGTVNPLPGNAIDVGTQPDFSRTGGTPTARWYIADVTNNFVDWNIANNAGPSANYNTTVFNESGTYLIRPLGINSCGVNPACCSSDYTFTVRPRTIVEVTPSFEDNCGSGVSLTANAWHHINRGLMAYYNFNGNINDQSGNNHHAVFPDGGQGARDPRYTEDRFGVSKRALLFDGNDFLTIPTLTDIRGDNNAGNEITVAYWFKGSNNQSAFRIQNGGNYLVSGWNTGIHILSNDGATANGISQGTVRDNQWHHVVLTWQRDLTPINTWYSAGTYKFRAYVDGVLVAERNSGQTAIPNINAASIIGSFLGTSEFTSGALDEMRIYRRALTQTEIQQLMGSGQAYNYSWTPGTDLSSTTAQTVIANPSSNNNYLVTATTGGGPASNNDVEDRRARIYRTANAIQFSTNQYVQVAPNAALRNVVDFTYEIWVRPTAFNSFNTYFENGQWNGNTLGFRQNSSTVISIFINGIVGYDLNYAPPLNQWTHLAVVRSGSTISLLANGSLVGNFTTTFSDPILPTGNLNIGASTHANTTQNFIGLLDEFRMWNRSLTAAEITARMHARITPTDAYWNNLQAYYKFDEAVGNLNVFDLSGNRNNGTIVNATRVALSPNTQTISGNNSVCYDNTSSTYTVTSAVSNARMYNYNWTVTGGTVGSGHGTTGITTSWTNLGAGSVNTTAVHSNECISETATAFNVNVNPNITNINTTITPTIAQGDWLWTGKNGVDYNAGNNWLQIGNANTFTIPTNAPSSNDNIFIVPASLTANCISTNEASILTATDNGNAKDFTVWTGANFHTKGILNVFGNFKNLGTASGNIFAFKGTGAQTVTTGYGSSTTPIVGKSYKKLVVDNSGNSTVTFNDNGYFIDKIEVENGTLSIPATIKTYTKKAETKKGVNIAGEMRVNDCNTPIGAIGTITGTTTGLVRNVEYTYSIPTVSNVALYTWNVPPGFIINRGQGTNSIVVTLGCAAVAGNVEVVAENSCGVVSNSLSIAVASILPQPSIISGTSSNLLCGQSYSYSISSVIGATNYVWQVPANYTITSGQGTTSITVTLGANASSGDISVTATGACGDVSPNRTLAVSTIPAPAQPGTITGTVSGILCGSTYNYSIVAIANSVSYTWSFPTGYTITSGQGTTSVNVSVANNAINGNITVFATNICGVNGTSRIQSITLVPTPAQPGTITGNVTNLCRNTPGYTYSISAVANASSYNWSVPSGYTITSGQGTTAITVTSGTNAGGVISVAAVNICGASSATTSTSAITFLAAPSQPGSISGCTAVGAASTGITYSISSVANATSYTWSVTGGTIASGQGTTSITVNFSRTVGSTTSGSVSVVANGCNGSSTAQTLSLSIGGKATYVFTGVDQTWTAPCGVNVAVVKVWGAGGGGGNGGSSGGAGGGGAFVMGTTAVSAGQNHTIIVGGGGAPGTSTASMTNAYGGGGASRDKAWEGGGGGGRSAFRNSSGIEIAIAGGGAGGGAGSNRPGGAAAGVGADGGKGSNCSGYGNGGFSNGTVFSGGNNSSGTAWNGTVGGSGGNAEDCCSDNSGGGGGGGFGGGQGGCSGNNDSGGGGGGSSRLSGFSSTSSIGGSGQTPGGTTDGDYASGIGSGGTGRSGGTPSAGGNGRVVVLY